MAYASLVGAAFIDQALYLLEEWTADPARWEEAGVPAHTAFATKGELARQMVARALQAGVPVA